MTTWREQAEIVGNYRVKEGQTLSLDCPFCGAKKKFTVSKRDGNLIWNCYRASCSVRGSKAGARSLDTIKARMKTGQPIKDMRRVDPIPAPLVAVEGHPEALAYLSSVGSLEAVRSHLAKAFYAPSENRVVFVMNRGAGCVGRALDGRKPKWKVYGDTTGVFACGVGKTAVIVEDPASACAVGVLPEYTGVALLGTNLSSLQKAQLGKYQRAIIALDKDASMKSVSILGRVAGLVPATVRFLGEDLKWLSSDQIRGALE